MTKVKICGLKQEEEIEFANQLQPEYVGLVFANSSRQINLEQARGLLKNLNRKIKKVGVFVNMDKQEVVHIANSCRLDVLQFHGDETPDYCNRFEQEVWKAFQIKNEESFMRIEQYAVDGYLLDSYMEGQVGGSGKTFPWELVQNLNRVKLLITAGGLNADNVEEAIGIMKPHVVDVSSGVEVNGKKDYEKMKLFIKKVREIS